MTLINGEWQKHGAQIIKNEFGFWSALTLSQIEYQKKKQMQFSISTVIDVGQKDLLIFGNKREPAYSKIISGVNNTLPKVFNCSFIEDGV